MSATKCTVCAGQTSLAWWHSSTCIPFEGSLLHEHVCVGCRAPHCMQFEPFMVLVLPLPSCKVNPLLNMCSQLLQIAFIDSAARQYDHLPRLRFIIISLLSSSTSRQDAYAEQFLVRAQASGALFAAYQVNPGITLQHCLARFCGVELLPAVACAQCSLRQSMLSCAQDESSSKWVVT